MAIRAVAVGVAVYLLLSFGFLALGFQASSLRLALAFEIRAVGMAKLSMQVMLYKRKDFKFIRSHAMLLLARSFSSLLELRAFPENGDPMTQNSTEGHLSLEADVFNSVRGMTFPGTRHNILPRRTDVLVPSTEPPHDAWRHEGLVPGIPKNHRSRLLWLPDIMV